MIDRLEALKAIRANVKQMPTENVPLDATVGRTLSSSVTAQLTQPAANMSAMDGYAIREADFEQGISLRLVGEAAAGHPFSGTLGEGDCLRVFTGSVVPDGADWIVMQENVSRDGNPITLTEPKSQSSNIRRAGIDFSRGDALIEAGEKITPRHLSVIAAANLASVDVRRRPRIAVLSNGDELRPPGSDIGPGQIVASNGYSLRALINAWGGEAIDLGTTKDDPAAIRDRLNSAGEVDVFVPVGGASVGDHDHMKPSFLALGFEEVFSKVAIKPGKPTWLYRRGDQLALGLPGNPASALVCAHIFLRPLIHAMIGLSDELGWVEASLSDPISANGQRESFMRGFSSRDEEGRFIVTPAGNQDSSLLSPFIHADLLIHRVSGDVAKTKGERVACIRLD